MSSIASVLLEAVRQFAFVFHGPSDKVPVSISAMMGTDVLLFARLAYRNKLADFYLALFDSEIEMGLLSSLFEVILVGGLLNLLKLCLFLFTSIMNRLLNKS